MRSGFTGPGSRCLAATPAESKVLSSLLASHRKEYTADTKAAEAILTVGISPRPKNVGAAELAAWTSVSRVLLNLNETITRNLCGINVEAGNVGF